MDAAIAERKNGRHLGQVFIEEKVRIDVPMSDAAVEEIVVTAVVEITLKHTLKCLSYKRVSQ